MLDVSSTSQELAKDVSALQLLSSALICLTDSREPTSFQE